MAKFSKDDTTPTQQGPGTEWRADLDGYTVSIVKVDAETDLSAGTEFVIFSPAEVMATVEAHMAARAQELFGASGPR